MKPTPNGSHRHRQPRLSNRARSRGLSLIEALVAFLVVSIGMLGLMRAQDGLRLNSEFSRQRSEALRLAQQDLEIQRAFATLQAQTGLQDYAALQSASHAIDTASGFQTNTAYHVQRQVAADANHALKHSDVQVTWADRRGQTQSLNLHSLVAGQDPALAAALSQAPRAQRAWGTHGRSPFIPQQAKDLGNGSSAFKPLSNGHTLWVFDNPSGRITATCSGATTAWGHGSLSTSQLGQCNSVNGLLLSGLVRFSLTNPPTADAANDLPLPLSMALQLSGPSSPAPTCLSEPVKAVQFTTTGNTNTEWVPLNATPHSWGMNSWFDTGERFTSYHCLIESANTGSHNSPAAHWSGQSQVVPIGWVIGQQPGQYRVCRYSSDTDHSGHIDRNQEHPALYTHVSTALIQQNFLVVRGELSCPTSPAINVDGTGLQVYLDWSTVQHQP